MHSIVFIELKTPPFKNRTWLTSMVCKRICDDPPTFLWVGVPLDTHPSIRPDDEHHAIRAEGSRCLRLTSIGPDLTRLEFCASLDLRGSLPQWLTDKVAVPTLLHVPYTIQVRTFRLPAAQAAVPLLVQKGVLRQVYFQQIRRLVDCQQEDGRNVAHMLADLAFAQGLSDLKARIAIRGFYMRCAMLLNAGFAHLDTFLVFMLRPAYIETSNTAPVGHTQLESPFPALLTVDCATRLGFELRRLMDTLQADDLVVGEMLRKHEVLRRMNRKFVWFKPLLEVQACVRALCACACSRLCAHACVRMRLSVCRQHV